jgi:Domain of unknown function (DUF1707)
VPELDRTLASDAERDQAVARLQSGFAEGRLNDAEFDERMRGALTARTRAELAGLMDGLPAERTAPAAAVPGRAPGRFAVTFKSSIRRAGRWRVPARFNAVAYKGGCTLDMRAAELTAPVTTIRAVAYKSRIDVLVPPGVRVEAGGMGVSTGPSAPGELVHDGSPVLHIRGFAYKGAIEVAGGTPEA